MMADFGIPCESRFFFFQAEDGIRDATVTGVQTCALPISYAVACFHDENRNGKLDTGLFGIPTEGWVVSNRATGGLGAPSFKDAKFSFPGTATELRLGMRY